MIPPGRWGPKEFAGMTDEELHQVKMGSQPGSNYWEMATAEQQERQRKLLAGLAREGAIEPPARISEKNSGGRPRAPQQHSGDKSLERYFLEPGIQGVLKPGVSGTACCNIRSALSALGYQREWRNADAYDGELEAVVRRFQETNGHPNVDGYVGPGTRKLLVKKLLAIDFDFTELLPTFEYDVALSFAGEDRSLAEALADILKAEHIRVFYDRYEQADLWGKDLIEHLEDVYGRKARFCVMFVSQAYARKVWPTHERRVAQERALQDTTAEYILPVRLDDTKVPGLRTTLGYIEIEIGIEQISKLLIEKIKQHRMKVVNLWSHAHSERFG